MRGRAVKTVVLEELLEHVVERRALGQVGNRPPRPFRRSSASPKFTTASATLSTRWRGCRMRLRERGRDMGRWRAAGDQPRGERKRKRRRREGRRRLPVVTKSANILFILSSISARIPMSGTALTPIVSRARQSALSAKLRAARRSSPRASPRPTRRRAGDGIETRNLRHALAHRIGEPASSRPSMAKTSRSPRQVAHVRPRHLPRGGVSPIGGAARVAVEK